MARVRTGRLALMIGGAALLTGCEEGRKFGLFKKKPAAPATETMLEAPESIETTRLDPIAAAGAALDRVEADKVTGTPVPGLAPAPKPSNLDKPYIQIGLFSVEDNANRTGTVLRGAGVAPTIAKDAAHGKTYWRVVAGPAFNSADRADLLKKVKDLGYTDAYFVTK